MTPVGRWIVGALMLAALGCENHHGDHSPTIFNITVRPLTPLVFGTRATYEFRVEFVDPDGDVFGGHCDLDTSIGFAEIPLSTGVDLHATSGIAVCLLDVTVLGRIVSGLIMLTDRHDNTSNAIAFELAAETSKSEAAAPVVPSVIGRSAFLQRKL